MKSTLLTTIIAVASAVAFAGDPTPESETDLPKSLTSALNGTKLREGLSDLVEEAAKDMLLVFPSEERICKKCFFYAAAKLLEILDDKKLTDLLGELGYEIWTGSGNDREIYIRGFFNKDTALKPNDVIDKLYEILCPRIDYMITEKTTYYNDYSLEVCAADDDWDESFDINYKVLGVKVFETDYSVDRGDAYAIIGALRAVEAVLCYLKGVDLSGDSSIPDLIARIASLIDGEADLETIVAELSDFLRTTKPRTGGQQWLNFARTYLKSALENIRLADQWILNTRTDRAQHIIGKDAEEIGHMIAYDVNNPIIALAREHCTTVSDMLSGPVQLSREDLVGILYTAGLFEKKVEPPWLAKKTYRLSLAPLFKASIKWVEKLPQVDGDYVCIDTLPDPTIGEIFNGFTKQDAITLLEELAVKEQFTYEGYVEYNVNMPYRDGTVGEDRLQHAQPRRIVMTVEGEGLLEYDATMENADSGSALALFVDGELIQTDVGGEMNSRQFKIEGSGEHTLVWVYTGPTDENGSYLREKNFGVHPLSNAVFYPACTLRVPVKDGLDYVVSNETTQAEVAAVKEDGANAYTVLSNDMVKIYFAAAAGYRFAGTPENPKTVGPIAADLALTAADLPAVVEADLIVMVPIVKGLECVVSNETTGAVLVGKEGSGCLCYEVGKGQAIAIYFGLTEGYEFDGEAPAPMRYSELTADTEIPRESLPKVKRVMRTLTIGVRAHLAYAVTVDGEEVAVASSTVEAKTYSVPYGETAIVIFAPVDGYVFAGTPTNPLAVPDIVVDTVLAAEDLPEVVWPTFTLTVPEVEGLETRVSTNGVALIPSVGDGYCAYSVASGAVVRLTFAPAEGYEFVGTPMNPVDVGPIAADLALTAGDLPQVKIADPDPPPATRPPATGAVKTSAKSATAKAAVGCVFAGWTCEPGKEPAAFAALSANEKKSAKLKMSASGLVANWLWIDEDPIGAVALTPTNLAVASQSYVTASVSGLPSGLKFDKKTLAITGVAKKDETKVVKVKVKNASGHSFAQSYAVTTAGGVIADVKSAGVEVRTDAPAVGVFDAAFGKVTGSKVVVPGKTVTLKATPAKGCIFLGWFEDAAFTVPAKGLSKDYLTASQKIMVLSGGRTLYARFVELKPWAVGTFNGGGADGIVTLTVNAKGKLSGKYLAGGNTWKLSAAAYTDHADTNDGEVFFMTVTAKAGSLTDTLELQVYKAGIFAEGKTCAFVAYRNGWKDEPLKAKAKELKGKKVSVPVAESGDGTVELTVGASGSVKAKLTATGLDGKPYSATCSTVLIPAEDPDGYVVFVYFPPKSGKFLGFADSFTFK